MGLTGNNRLASRTTITGSTVSIGGSDFEVDPPRTIYGTAANQPSASDAHAAIAFAYYVSVDTQVVDQTDGSSWVAV